MARSFLTVGAMLVLLTLASSLTRAAETFYLGSVAMDIPAAMVQRLSPLAEYLAKKTGTQFTFRASPDLGTAVSDLGTGNTHLAYLTPIAYVDAQDRYGIVPIAAPVTRGKETFQLMIVVREDSNVRSIQDLRGRSFAFGDEKALLQRAVVVNSGVRLEDFSKVAFLKHYDNISKAILNRDFDAGILKDTTAFAMQGKGLRVIYRSPPLPPYVIAAGPHLPPRMIARVRDALLALDRKEPDAAAILGQLDESYDGFAVVKDADYDIIRSLVAPFRKR